MMASKLLTALSMLVLLVSWGTGAASADRIFVGLGKADEGPSRADTEEERQSPSHLPLKHQRTSRSSTAKNLEQGEHPYPKALQVRIDRLARLIKDLESDVESVSDVPDVQKNVTEFLGEKQEELKHRSTQEEEVARREFVRASQEFDAKWKSYLAAIKASKRPAEMSSKDWAEVVDTYRYELAIHESEWPAFQRRQKLNNFQESDLLLQLIEKAEASAVTRKPPDSIDHGNSRSAQLRELWIVTLEAELASLRLQQQESRGERSHRRSPLRDEARRMASDFWWDEPFARVRREMTIQFSTMPPTDRVLKVALPASDELSDQSGDEPESAKEKPATLIPDWFRKLPGQKEIGFEETDWRKAQTITTESQLARAKHSQSEIEPLVSVNDEWQIQETQWRLVVQDGIHGYEHFEQHRLARNQAVDSLSLDLKTTRADRAETESQYLRLLIEYLSRKLATLQTE